MIVAVSDHPPHIRRILISVALSPRAEALIGEGAKLCQRLKATPVFLHCGEDTPTARVKLEALIHAHLGEEPPPIHFRKGDPADLICALAREENVDLILAGALEKEGWVESIWGSVARRIARHAHCSVLLLPHPRSEGSHFEQMAAAIDTNEHSARAMGLILDVAQGIRAREFHFLSERSGYFGWLHSHYLPGRSDAGDPTSRARAEERFQLASFLASFDLDNFHLTLAQLEGGRGAAIAEYVREKGIEILAVVAPPRPLTFWDRFFHHAAEGIMEDIPCAFVVVRPQT